jgi:hypothetical protein
MSTASKTLAEAEDWRCVRTFDRYDAEEEARTATFVEY